MPRIVLALESLVEAHGATLSALMASSDLITLDSVVADASGKGSVKPTLEQLAGSAHRFLTDATNALEPPGALDAVPNSGKAAAALLGLKPEHAGRSYRAVKGRSGRQVAVAEWLGVPRESVDRKRGTRPSPRAELIERIAEALVLRNNEYRAEELSVAQRARRAPLESAMHVEWLGRFEAYFRIFSPMSGLHHDLEMALESKRSGDADDAALFARKSLYYYTTYLAELHRFVEERGGLWFFPDVSTEDAIADATWFVRRPVPLDEVDESMLRKLHQQDPELSMFLHESFNNKRLQGLMTAWEAWLLTCKCSGVDPPDDRCKVHAVIRWSRFYMDAVEAQWDFLADWYARPRSGTKVDPVAVARQGHPVLPPKLDKADAN